MDARELAVALYAEFLTDELEFDLAVEADDFQAVREAGYKYHHHAEQVRVLTGYDPRPVE